MSWSDRDKNRFFDEVKNAVNGGATPEDMFKELEDCYYTALDDAKKSAEYSFRMLKKPL
jgi:hypothetical protein